MSERWPPSASTLRYTRGADAAGELFSSDIIQACDQCGAMTSFCVFHWGAPMCFTCWNSLGIERVRALMFLVCCVE